MLKIWKKAIPTVFGLGLLAAPQHAPAQERSLLDEAIAEDIACVVRYGKDPLCVETAKTAVSVCMSGSMLVSNDMDRIRTACNAYIKRKFLEGYVAAGGR